MNPTLFSELQRLFERTYANVGINLEDCLIDRSRCAHLSRLAGAASRELSDLARTFLRTADDRLYVGIYYSSWLIEQLEKYDPRSGLSNANIRSLIMFVEEINHALHAALQFKAGLRRIDSEDFARNLELQGLVDTYLVLLLYVAFSAAARRYLEPIVAGSGFIYSSLGPVTLIKAPICELVTWKPVSSRPNTPISWIL
ncbi:MAG TPA: hypothetical protein VE641_11620 [Chthoniobacterales bacterium]|nr:hypothetical protein [Chthoniobacterales bacterium]